MRDLKVGDIVKLKADLLGNDEGAQGVVVQEYFIGEKSGVQVIFENGEFDGFSIEEQQRFLHRTGHEYSLDGYRFINVTKLSKDFDAGMFDMVFN
jgi:hypothetical protein